MKRYLENTIENMRDIGRYTAGDYYVLEGKIIRSNLPDKISINDKDFLKRIGIKNIIDLRSSEELQSKPSIFANDKNFNFYHLEIIGGKEIPKSCDDVPVSYLNMLESKESIKGIFGILKKGEKVLYFCNAGKDRTGVVTALILATLGVDVDDIARDYILTKDFMKDTLKDNNFSKEIIEIITPKVEYIYKFFEYLYRKYNSVEEYLNLIGISNEDIRLIRKNYLQFKTKD